MCGGQFIITCNIAVTKSFLQRCQSWWRCRNSAQDTNTWSSSKSVTTFQKYEIDISL